MIDHKTLIPGCKHFTWGEALYLPSWKVYHIPSQQEIDNITKLAHKMDLVREFLNCPLIVHVWIRPILNCPGNPHHGHDYNAAIGGATHSAHKTGDAVDYHPTSLTCDEGRAKLLSKLEEFNLRMENLPHSGWIHNDQYPAGAHRFFIP